MGGGGFFLRVFFSCREFFGSFRDVHPRPLFFPPLSPLRVAPTSSSFPALNHKPDRLWIEHLLTVLGCLDHHHHGQSITWNLTLSPKHHPQRPSFQKIKPQDPPTTLSTPSISIFISTAIISLLFFPSFWTSSSFIFVFSPVSFISSHHPALISLSLSS